MTEILGTIGQTGPGEQLRRVFAADPAARGSDLADPLQPAPAFANPSDDDAYRKLYEYNLGLTGDKLRTLDRLRSLKDRPPGPQSPLEALLGGQPGAGIDPAQLRAALALGMAGMHKQPAAAPASAPGERPPSSKLRYLFWFVMVLSAGAIIESFAIR